MRPADTWKDYELLDATDGNRLERWGETLLIRPDPQVVWKTPKQSPLWAKADAIYHRSNQGGGEWEYRRRLPEKWKISCGEGEDKLTLIVSPTGFKHTGVFPEQAVNWAWYQQKIRAANRPVKVLNLFGYTGGATLACAAAGATVCHVDASKGIVAWGKDNAVASGLTDKPIRWLVDDCAKFVAREKRRGKVFGRDQWISLQSAAETTLFQKTQSGGILLGREHMMFARHYSILKNEEKGMAKNLAAVQSLAQRYPGRVNLMLVPSASVVYPENVPAGAPQIDEKGVLEGVAAQGEAYGRFIDVLPALTEHKGEYLYYRTDHHWTQLGAYYAYTAFCEAAGFDAVPLEQFQTGRYDTFLGSMYTFTKGYPQSDVLKQHPDYLDYYLPIADTHARYYADGSLENGTPVSVVYTQLDESVSNKYLCFIGGDTPVCIVESDVQGPTCIVLKESYGNAFVPFLTSHYGRIIVIDPREFNQEGKPTLDLAAFAADQGVDDLIVINYPYMINSKAFVRYLNALAGVK